MKEILPENLHSILALFFRSPRSQERPISLGLCHLQLQLQVGIENNGVLESPSVLCSQHQDRSTHHILKSAY